MRFSVQFKSGNGMAALNILKKDVGLEGVDVIRESLDDLRYPLEQIVGITQGTVRDPIFKLRESQARASARFGRRNHIRVYVPDGFLNKFAHRIASTGKIESRGAASFAWVTWRLDKITLLREWLKARAPLIWSEVKGPTSGEFV